MPERIEQQNSRLGTEGRSAWMNIAVLGLALAGLLSQKSHAPVPSRVISSPARTKPSAPDRPAVAPAAAAAPVDHPSGMIGIGRSIADRIGRDNITLVAAGIAFYAMLSLFPALAALVSLYGLVGNPADVARRISDYGNLLPPEALKLITGGLDSFASKNGSQLSLALVTSVLLALWSARAGVTAVMTGLNIAYEEVEQRSFIMQNVVALLLTLGSVVFGVVVMVGIAVIPLVLKLVYLGNVAATVINIARWPILAVLVVFGFAVIYRIAPSRSHARWRWITWGSAIAALLWLLGSFAFSFYVGAFGSYDATYGSLGAVVVLLLWLWVSALVLLFGAEIDAELDKRATEGGSPLASVPAGAGPPVERHAA
jgi:membrane protein